MGRAPRSPGVSRRAEGADIQRILNDATPSSSSRSGWNIRGFDYIGSPPKNMGNVPIPNQGTLVWAFQMESGHCSVKALPHSCPRLNREKLLFDESDYEGPDERTVADDKDMPRPIGTIW